MKSKDQNGNVQVRREGPVVLFVQKRNAAVPVAQIAETLIAEYLRGEALRQNRHE